MPVNWRQLEKDAEVLDEAGVAAEWIAAAEPDPAETERVNAEAVILHNWAAFYRWRAEYERNNKGKKNEEESTDEQ